MTENKTPYRGLSEDFKAWFFDGSKRYDFPLKQFSFEQVDKLITSKVEEYEEYAKGVFTGKITEAQRIRKQNELAKHVFMTAFEGFTEANWNEITQDTKLGRGAIIQSMKEVWSFLAEWTNSSEAQLFQTRLNMTR